MDEYKRVRIGILHNNQLFRESLVCCLAHTEWISITHAGSRLEDLAEGFGSDRPDLLILQFALIRRDAVDKVITISALSSQVKILIIEVPNTEDDILYCIEKGGASGYLLSNGSLGELLNNLKAIVRGETLCSPRIARLTFWRISQLASQNGNVRAFNGMRLTRRESEIMTLIEKNLHNKEIAVRLHIEVSTVKNHVHNILEKLRLHDRHSAVTYLKKQCLAAS
jgi:DNA-binding NarL/FixJ family response regulator